LSLCYDRVTKKKPRVIKNNEEARASSLIIMILLDARASKKDCKNEEARAFKSKIIMQRLEPPKQNNNAET